MAVDRAALHQFVTGSALLGEYTDTQWSTWEAWRRALLAECRDRGIAVTLLGTTTAQTHAPVPTLLADVAAQTGERWPDTTRTDGRSWSLPETVQQVRLCALALDAADNPPPAPVDGGYRDLPVMTSAAITTERSSFQSAVPTFEADGMHVALSARGDLPGTPNPTSGTATQRCEAWLAGWTNLTGRLFLRYDFTLEPGFPIDTTTWQAITQCKNSGSGSPPLEIMVGNGEIYLQWHSSSGAETGREVLGKATTGVKHEVILDVAFTSTGSQAFVTGYMDGAKVFGPIQHGPTLYSGQTSYGKAGIYRNNTIGVPAEIAFHAVAKGTSLASVT